MSLIVVCLCVRRQGSTATIRTKWLLEPEGPAHAGTRKDKFTVEVASRG